MSEPLTFKIRRQDRPGSAPYWQAFQVEYEPGLNVTSCLQRIAARPVTAGGRESTPVAYEAACLEEVCGSCTMRINGLVRQACSSLVDDLIDGAGREIILEPMSKFPVVRDLFVDRAAMFRSLQRIKAWVPVDGYHHVGPGPRRTPADQEAAYPFSQCMTCGCCVESCPQFGPHSDFIGPAAIGQVIYFNSHPVGRFHSAERMDVLLGRGGIADCGNSQNCVKVCPKEIPLTISIARAGRRATLHALQRMFDR